MRIGVLDVQGAVTPHCEKLQFLGVDFVRIKQSSELSQIDGIILPGGESTAMIHLLKLNDLWNPLREFVGTKPSLGVCAGAILLANEVAHPSQESLRAIGISVARNAYGRQIDSFIANTEATEFWRSDSTIPVEAVFIRAPIIAKMDSGVRPLLMHGENPVLVEEKNLLACTFHPELTESLQVHQYFVNKCRG